MCAGVDRFSLSPVGFGAVLSFAHLIDRTDSELV